MAASSLSDVARQLFAEQGDEATEHLAEAIRALRAVGDDKGAKLLAKIARQVEELDRPDGMRIRLPGGRTIRRA